MICTSQVNKIYMCFRFFPMQSYGLSTGKGAAMCPINPTRGTKAQDHTSQKRTFRPNTKIYYKIMANSSYLSNFAAIY